MSVQSIQSHIPNVVAEQCAQCDEDVAVGEGIVAVEQVWWVGARNATVWCGLGCCDQWSESAFDAREEGRLAAYYG